WILSKAMDSHNVGRGRESVEAALKTIQAKTLVVGIENDFLYPIQEQKFLAELIPGAQLESITSLYGHDGFLVEFDQFKNSVRKFLKRKVEVVV
ncbi:MAG: homoserine O-acetyltransferase, partial [Flammeovirgaceae bacterium]